MPTVVTAGELLVELMRPESGVSLGEVGTFRGPFPSGAPAIFVDAVERLGVESGIVGSVGADAFGDAIRERLAADGVDVSHVGRTPRRTTGVAFVTYFDDGSREFLFHLGHAAAGQVDPDRIGPSWVEDCEVVHVSGSAVAVNDAMAACCEHLVELACEQGARVSFDPNIRPSLLEPTEGAGPLDRILDRADIVIPTIDELASLVPGDGTEAERASCLLDRGAELVAVTKGADGCTLYAPDEIVQHPGFAVETVDPTGAGDAFAAGLVVATLEERSLPERAAFANAVGSRAVATFGPMEGLPTRADVEAVLAAG